MRLCLARLARDVVMAGVGNSQLTAVGYPLHNGNLTAVGSADSQRSFNVRLLLCRSRAKVLGVRVMRAGESPIEPTLRRRLASVATARGKSAGTTVLSDDGLPREDGLRRQLKAALASVPRAAA